MTVPRGGHLRGWRCGLASGFCDDRVEFCFELAGGLDAIATLKQCVDFCNQLYAVAWFCVAKAFVVLQEEVEVALGSLGAIAVRECKLDDSGRIAVMRHAADDSCNVARILREKIQVAFSELGNALDGVSGIAEVLEESVGKQCVERKTVMGARAEYEVRLDGSGVGAAIVVDPEGQWQFGLCGENFVSFCAGVDTNEIIHINASL